MSEQLELFTDEPFCLRLRIDVAMNIFWDHYWQFLPTAKSTKAHRKRIEFFFKDRFIDTISKADVEDFRKKLSAEGLDGSTINQAHMLLSRMFSKLNEYKQGRFAHGIDYSNLILPTKNPASLVPKTKWKRRKQIITISEWNRLKYYADDDMTDILNMLMWTRLRPGDLRRITSNEVDIQRKKIEGIQHKTITMKNPTGLPYMVPIVQEISDILLPRLARTKPESPLFPFKNMQKRWKELRSLANVSHVQMRDIRRTAPTFLIDSGVDSRTVSEGLGHADETMLPTYTPRSLHHQIRSMEMLVEKFK